MLKTRPCFVKSNLAKPKRLRHLKLLSLAAIQTPFVMKQTMVVHYATATTEFKMLFKKLPASRTLMRMVSLLWTAWVLPSVFDHVELVLPVIGLLIKCWLANRMQESANGLWTHWKRQLPNTAGTRNAAQVRGQKWICHCDKIKAVMM